MKKFTKGFILAVYILMDIIISVGIYLFIVTIKESIILSQKVLLYFVFPFFLVFICFMIFRQFNFLKHGFFNVKSISIDDENIYIFKGKKTYTYSIDNIKKVKIRGDTTTIYCNSPKKKYILDTKIDSPFFTENVNHDEIKTRLIYSRFI